MRDQTPDLIGDLVAKGRLRVQRPDRRALMETLESARRDLPVAEAIRATSPNWAEAILYEAGLRCARVIVQAAGWRISADHGHQTAIDAADEITGGRSHRRFVRLHRMRRVRHEFMYQVGHEPSQSDLDTARSDVDALILEAEAALGRLQ